MSATRSSASQTFFDLFAEDDPYMADWSSIGLFNI